MPRLGPLWRNLFRRARVERELDEELREYVALVVEDKQRAGLPAAEARRQTLAELGGLEPVKERVRQVRNGALLEQIAQDVAFGGRMLRKHAGFTAVASITLALGVGANTAVFSVVDTAVFRPLPYAHPEQLLKICSISSKPRPCEDDFTAEEFDAIRTAGGAFAAVAADDGTMATVARADGSPEPIGIGFVTATWLSTLGVSPIFGRDFTADEQRRGRDGVVILTHEYWKRRFNGDRQALGATLVINHVPHTIVGVLPPNIVRVYADVIKPLVLDGYTDRSLDVFGRLAPGMSAAQARAELAILAARRASQRPPAERDRGFDVMPLGKYYAPISANAVRGLLLMLGAVALVLLIACANVSNLLLARAAARRRESVVRAAIGASRGRLVRQFLIECVLLFLAGGALGAGVARLSLDWLQALSAAGGYLPERMELVMDARVLAATFAVMLLTGLVFGLAPALQASKVDLASGLRDAARTSAPGRITVRRTLIAGQLALSLVLLAAFGLLARSFGMMYAASGGFSPEHVLITAADGGRSFPESVTFWRAALVRLRAIPGVTAAAVSSRPPIHNVRRRSFVVEGSPPPLPEAAEQAGDVFVSADYFGVLGIPILKGRAFVDGDNETSRPVAVISESVARRAFHGVDPLGRRILLVERAPLTCCSAAGPIDGVWREVVGVVGDVRQANLDDRPAPTIYRPFSQMIEHDMFVVVRVDKAASEGRVAAAVRAELVAPGGLPHRDWDDVRTMADVIHESSSIRMRRFILVLLGGFAAIALVLAAVGVFGVASSAVTERTREIGVRMALGATGPAILRHVMGELLVLAAAGFAAGTAAMLAVTRVIQSMLFGVGATDAATYAGVAGVLAAAILFAACAPARRAMRIDPMIALRGD